MWRYLGCFGGGLLLLILGSTACGVGHVGAAGYQSGFYYPYYPWYWGGLYYHYPWVNTHYIDYHGGYTRNGTLAPGYRYDPQRNVVLSRSGQPVYPNPRGLNDIKTQGNTPNPRTLSNAPPSVRAAPGSCSGQNNCTGGGSGATNKSGGPAPPGNGSGGSASGCSGQSNCTGGGNGATKKSGGSTGSNGSTGQTSSGSSGSSTGPSRPSGPPKPSGPSGGSRSGGSRSGGGRR